MGSDRVRVFPKKNFHMEPKTPGVGRLQTPIERGVIFRFFDVSFQRG